jgi:hypothetical protein
MPPDEPIYVKKINPEKNLLRFCVSTCKNIKDSSNNFYAICSNKCLLDWRKLCLPDGGDEIFARGCH